MRFCSITTQSLTPTERPTNSAIVERRYPSSAMIGPHDRCVAAGAAAGRQQRAGLEGLGPTAEIDHALGEQPMVALHHSAGESILARVLVAPQIGEQSPHLAPCGPTEEIRELHRALAAGMALGQERARVAERGRHREQLHDDVNAPEEEALLALQARLIGHDPVEALASELAASALDEAHVRRQAAEVAIAERRCHSFEPKRRIPGR